MSAPRIVYVVSSEFSGSTMLAMILGSHSSGAAIGETDFLFRKKSDGGWRHKKWCTICDDVEGERCPVFTREIVEAIRAKPEEAYAILATKLGGAAFFADSSKDIRFWGPMLERQGARARVVHLTKSVESYVASVSIRHPSSRPLELIAHDWAASNVAMRSAVAKAGVPYLHVRYLDLVTSLDDKLDALGAFVGFTPEPGQKTFWEKPHHVLRGSTGTATHFDRGRADRESGVNGELYRTNHRKIFVDEKWRTTLTPSQIDRIYALPSVAEESAVYGYQHPLAPGGSPMSNRLVSALIDPTIHLARRMRQVLGK